MNEFSTRLGALAQGVSREFEASAPDDSAVMVRRAKRGRVVWTGTVGSATLATAAAVAFGGSAAASSAFGATATPATHQKPLSDSVDKEIPLPEQWSKIDELTADALAAKIAAEKAAAEKAAAEQAAAEKAAADKAAADKAAKKAAKEKAAKDKSKKSKSKSGKSKSGVKDGNCDGQKGQEKGDWKSKSGKHKNKDKEPETETGDDSSTEG